MVMKIKKMSAFLLVLFLLFSNRTVTSSAAENAGIGISVSPETVQAGERVTVTVSLTDYDEEAVPIRGMQIDVTDVDESILTVEDGSYVSLINDPTAVENVAVYQQFNQLLRLLYIRWEGTLAQPYEDVFQMTFLVNPELTEAGSITLPLTAKFQTTESRVTLNDEIKISYVPAGEQPDPDVVSVDIEWGGMDYAYTEGTWNTDTHSYDNSGWDDGGSGYVKVTNSGNVDTTAEFVFESDREEISGSFTDGANTVSAPLDIAAGQSWIAYLHLSGEPADDLNNTKIGTVTVKIGGE